MVIGGEASRHSMAVAVSLAGHAVLLSLLASGAFVRLSVVPSPLILSLVEPAASTAGPGERSPRLRVAAGRPSAMASGPHPPAPAARPVAAPPPVPESKPVSKVKPAPARRADKALTVDPAVPKPPPSAHSGKALPPAPAAAEPGTEVASLAPGAPAGSASGADEKSTAPSWAPEARVRYEELLFAWMDRYKQYPMLARRRGLEGSGSIRVRIDREGRVVERAIQRSTGEIMLDRAALDMVRRANPFPAVPEDYAGEGFEFVAPIQYRLR